MYLRLAALAAFMLLPCLASGETRPPNIVVIMADDLGYGDIGCYGATKIRTPNIDRLAGQGMRFLDAHSAASICSPSRYSLMTGRYSWRLHKKGNGYQLDPQRPTIASMLKEQGYRNAAIGKWHLGYGKNWEHPLSPGPLEVGFDYHFGVPTNHNDKYRAFVENRGFYGLEEGNSLKVVEGRDFPTGLAEPRIEDQVDTTLTSKAVQFIRDNADRPFFLYFTPCAPHTHITPAAEFRGTSEAGLMGDYIQELDKHVGEIVATLDELGLTENTLLVFTSDNGNSPKDFRGTQNMLLNLADDSGDIRTKFKTAKADAKKLGHKTNGPWRDGKGTPFEGGHRIPMVIRWPGQVEPETTCSQTLCLTDLFATFADVVGATIPDNAAEDSITFRAQLADGQSANPQRLFTFIQGDGKDKAIAVRYLSWKLIQTKNPEGESANELYDLINDPTESVDISNQNPQIVSKMTTALERASDEGRTRPVSSQAGFFHPGVSHSQQSLDAIKDKLSRSKRPWQKAWERLDDSRYSSLRWEPTPHEVVERGPYNDPDIGGTDFLRDGTAAYAHALKWALSGDQRNAQKAAEILDAWSETLRSVENHDARLLIGMAGLRYCNAAELLKHRWNGWPKPSQQKFETMLRDVWYPIIKDFYPSANGNWDASMLQTMIGMSVFLDDREMFDRATGYYRDGKGNGSIQNYFSVTGQCQETGRDQAHTQMGLDFLANTCEVAWNQNLDLYGELDNRLLKGFEYTAKYNLGFDVEYEPFRSVDGRYHYKSISDDSRGRLRPMYEKVLNHYENRMGREAPFTEKAVEKLRLKRGRSKATLPWDTLLFSN
jgi:arylsulfatase A-like enzyme